MNVRSYDYVLVGGGLQNGLIALAVRALRPEATIAVVERARTLGGNHTWSFHGSDVPESARAFTEPLVVARWSGFDVAFPRYKQTFYSAYASIDSARLHAVVTSAVGGAGHGRRSTVLLGAAVRSVGAHEVVLDDGSTLTGAVVVDARGPDRTTSGDVTGFQKFLGLELELDRDHGLTRPTLMDATVAQRGGLRFFYVLPLSERRVLVEDTYYSRDPSLDEAELRAEIHRYADAQGLGGGRVVREERGCLPIPLTMKPVSTARPLLAGYGGGFFHPTTGYSFPVALKLAHHLARSGIEGAFGPELDAFVAEHEQKLRFALLLNRLFFATPPEHQRELMSRLHRLPLASIRRFYALSTTRSDLARLFLLGRPPPGVSLRTTLAEVWSA